MNKRPGHCRSLFSNKLFIILASTHTISEFGTQFTRIALLLEATRVSASPAALSAIFFIQILPVVVLGPFAGALVDRFNRKTTMIVTDLLRACVVAVYPLANTISSLCFIAAVVAMLDIFHRPARSSLIPEVVSPDDLTAAASVNQFISNGIVLLGPAAAGVLIAASGSTAAFFVDASTFFLSAAVLAVTKLPVLFVSGGRGLSKVLRDAKDGLRFMASVPPIRFFLTTLAIVFMGGGIAGVLQYHYALNIIKVGETGVGAFLSLCGLGGITSALLLGQFGRRLPRGRLMFGAAGSLGVCFSAYLFRPAFGPLLVIGFVGNLLSVACTVPMYAMLYELVPGTHRGRVFSIVGALFNLPTLAAYVIAGGLASIIPANVVIGTVGVLMAAGTYLVTRTGQYRVASSWQPASTTEGHTG